MADRWQRQPGSQTVVNYGKAGWTLQIIKGVARRSGAMAKQIQSIQSDGLRPPLISALDEEKFELAKELLRYRFYT